MSTTGESDLTELELLRRENQVLRRSVESLASSLAPYRPDLPESTDDGLPQASGRPDIALVQFALPRSREIAFGAPKPLMMYAEHAADHNGPQVELIRGEDIARSPEARRKVKSAKAVIVNGLQAFLFQGVFDIPNLNSNTWFYLHETEWVWNDSERKMPERYQRVRETLRQNGVLTCSDKQRMWLRELVAPIRDATIYNCVEIGAGDASIVPSQPGLPHKILMVGSMQPRKGVDLFSATADLAKQESRPYDFVWVGDTGLDSPHFRRSENATWLGRADGEQIRVLMANSSAFFLSSIDDPLPLVVSEALSTGLGCAVYANTGSEEIVRGIEGCAVFDQHVAASALAAIDAVVEGKLDPVEARSAAERFTGVEAFARRLEQAVLA